MISKLLKKNEKGFTLMEMLIVVAIIAVLVAIAIPTFTSSLNKAKVATDQANIRAGYASAMLQVLAPDMDASNTKVADGAIFNLQKDGSVKLSTATDQANYVTVGKAAANTEVAGQKIAAGWNAGATVTYKYTESNGNVQIIVTNPTVGG